MRRVREVVGVAIALLAVSAFVQAEVLTHTSGIEFDVPDKWTQSQEGDELMLVTPGQDLLVHFAVIPTTGVSSYLDNLDSKLEWIEEQELTGEPEEVEVNGLSHLYLQGTGKVDGDPTEWMLAVVSAGPQAMVVVAVGDIQQYHDRLVGLCSSIKAPAVADTSAGAGGPRPSAGGFTVVYDQTQAYDHLRTLFVDSKIFDTLATELNAAFNLPRTIPIHLLECGQVNAFYDSAQGQLLMCYELIDSLYDTFAKAEEDEEERTTATLNATLFVFFHEMGHALIDVLDIPVTGKEEDAVDQVATLVLTAGGADGEKAALDGARYWAIDSDTAPLDEHAFADEHSLSSQRFFNILCWVFGSNPEGNAFIVSEGFLPEARAVRCPDEYARMQRSWDALLSPHMTE